jgi:protein-S-isoprenylcysteine O-methyltransferase Ste14
MNVNMKVLVAEVVALFAVFAVVLFLAAGTVAWTAGWAYLILFFGFVVALTWWLFRHNPGLLTERMSNFKRDQKGWDKLFFSLLNVIFLAWLVLMPLDAVRFQWSHVPVGLQALGAAMLLGSFELFFLVYRENSYLSPMVRIQTDRGQTVISTGPYAYVRHPMYAAALPWIVGTALLLGSGYGLLSGLVLVLLIALRAVLEERTLREELPGYDTYMTRVRYRLIPHVW